MKPKPKRSGRRTSKRPKRRTRDDATDADLSEFFASDEELREGLATDEGLFESDEGLFESLSGDEPNERRRETRKRKPRQAKSRTAAGPGSAGQSYTEGEHRAWKKHT